MVEDLDNALQDAHSGEVAFGNHTSTVILRHSNPEILENVAHEVIKFLNALAVMQDLKLSTIWRRF